MNIDYIRGKKEVGIEMSSRKKFLNQLHLLFSTSAVFYSVLILYMMNIGIVETNNSNILVFVILFIGGFIGITTSNDDIEKMIKNNSTGLVFVRNTILVTLWFFGVLIGAVVLTLILYATLKILFK